MLELYTMLLITGILFAVVSVLLGDVIGQALDGAFDWMSGDALHALQPMVLFSGMTVLGGAGYMLTKFSSLSAFLTLALSVLIAVGTSVLIYFLYVKPMNNSERSVAFSMKELVGKIGEVSVPIPAKGCGEVVYRIGGGLTNQIAESFDGTDIASGARVVTIELRDGAVLVSPLYDNLDGE
ncbi:protease [Paenibacillus sp. YYML68]|uniref:protease n=1 Tax=Paenibacillus sp. YYML68 TaxID=2909250 RepID=UPI002490290E|nr:protease [Paenibacillus sp. YYML68]